VLSVRLLGVFTSLLIPETKGRSLEDLSGIHERAKGLLIVGELKYIAPPFLRRDAARAQSEPNSPR